MEYLFDYIAERIVHCVHRQIGAHVWRLHRHIRWIEVGQWFVFEHHIVADIEVWLIWHRIILRHHLTVEWRRTIIFDHHVWWASLDSD